MEVAHSHRGHAFGGQLCGGRPDGIFIERPQHAAVSGEALGNADAPVARHERLGPSHVQVVLLEPVLVGHLDRVADALGREQRRASAAAFDEGVGGERGAVDEHLHIGGLDAGGCENRLDAVEHGIGRGLRGRQHLRGVQLTGTAVGADFERDVGERAADVGREPGAPGGHPPSVGAPSGAAPCAVGDTVQAWRAAISVPAGQRRGPVRDSVSASCERRGIPRSWTGSLQGSRGVSMS